MAILNVEWYTFLSFLVSGIVFHAQKVYAFSQKLLNSLVKTWTRVLQEDHVLGSSELRMSFRSISTRNMDHRYPFVGSG